MPTEPQAVARFPGVLSVIGGAFTWGHGETPSVCVLQIAPQLSRPALIGTLTITYGGEVLAFPDCRIVAASYRRDAQGRIVELSIEDWRWKWRERGLISGRYNVRRTDGTIVTHTEKSPQDMARLLFEALGQASYDVSQLPDTPRPYIEWDVANPGRALSDLCELLGCRIAPGFDNKAFIVRLGSGTTLTTGPGSGIVDINESLDPPEKPEVLMVVGGPAEFQADFELEAVALEPNGEYVELDSASYKPDDGWSYDATDTFEGLPTAKYRDKNLARESVYRSYRVKIPAGGLDLPGYTDSTGKKIERLDQLVFLNRQCEQVDQIGEKAFLPPLVYGAFEGDNHLENATFGNTINTPEPITDLDSDLAKKCTYRQGFSLDGDKGIVQLSQRLILVDETDNTLSPAQLRLRVAVNVRDKDTGGLLRHTRKRTYVAGSTAPPAIIRRDEIVARCVPAYQSGSTAFTVTSINYNVDEVDREADYYLDIEEQTWQELRPIEATYGKIIKLAPDGAIHHIVWSFGNSAPATTRVGRNTEFANYITPYRQRRLNAQIRALAGNHGVAAQ